MGISTFRRARGEYDATSPAIEETVEPVSVEEELPGQPTEETASESKLRGRRKKKEE